MLITSNTSKWRSHDFTSPQIYIYEITIFMHTFQLAYIFHFDYCPFSLSARFFFQLLFFSHYFYNFSESKLQWRCIFALFTKKKKIKLNKMLSKSKIRIEKSSSWECYFFSYKFLFFVYLHKSKWFNSILQIN